MFGFFVSILVFALPSKLKIHYFRIFKSANIDSSATIGYSFINVNNLSLGAGSRIGHLNVIKGLDCLKLGSHSSISNLNWITAFPTATNSRHFSTETNRRAELSIGIHSAITNRHLIDCTNVVSIGSFSTFAGFRSQILTHSINIDAARQESGEVYIGDYCFVGTSCVILPGSRLPSFSILGALSLLNKIHIEEYVLYGGTPAVPIKKISRDARYFSRSIGFLD